MGGHPLPWLVQGINAVPMNDNLNGCQVITRIVRAQLPMFAGAKRKNANRKKKEKPN
jgi:hypothetical protein